MTVKVNAVGAKAPPKMASIAVVVHRACKCGQPAFTEDYPRGWDFCPRCAAPSVRENRGTVAYWHRNPFKRFSYWLKRRFGHGPVQT